MVGILATRIFFLFSECEFLFGTLIFKSEGVQGDSGGPEINEFK